MAYKNRKKKMVEYESKYSHIPKDYYERLEWMYDNYNISDKKAENILRLREEMIDSLKYETISFVLYEIPAGKERPRFRIISKNQLINSAINNPEFVHVYSLSGHDDHVYMNRLVNSTDFIHLEQLLCTPVFAEFIAYFPTPKSYSQERTFLAEIGLDRPISKPDFDNIDKKYADMFNHTIWLDDIFVLDSCTRKFYSILPRLEIRLHFLNMVYNKHQYDMITKRKDFTDDMNLNYFGGGNSNGYQKNLRCPVKRIKNN